MLHVGFLKKLGRHMLNVIEDLRKGPIWYAVVNGRVNGYELIN